MPEPSGQSFDAHLHIIDPRFPLIPNQGYLPPAFSCAEYRRQAAAYGFSGGAIVSGSFQGLDQSYLTAALAQLGPRFVGVTQLPVDCADSEILELHRQGVRAVRFNLYRGGSEPIHQLEHLAHRVNELCHWHTELYIDMGTAQALLPRLRALPAIAIDHLGLSHAGLAHLYALVEQGAHVKASGFGRVDFDVLPVLQQIHRINPHALLFGSDLPSTRAPRPFQQQDLALIEDHFEPAAQERILWRNAHALYRPRASNDAPADRA